MEGLAPPLKLLLSLRNGIEKGDSIRTAVQSYLLRENDELARLVATWVSEKDQGLRSIHILGKVKSPFRQATLMLMDRGLRGESIYAQVTQLEEEVYEASKCELETFLRMLPMKMLIPLLLFQFPAFLLLMLGPLLGQLLKNL